MLEDGREYCYVFSGSQAHVRMREGQKVSLILAFDKKDNEMMCALVNHSTQTHNHINRPYEPPIPGGVFWGLMLVGALSAYWLWFVPVPIILICMGLRMRRQGYIKHFNKHVEDIAQFCYTEKQEDSADAILIAGEGGSEGIITQHIPQPAHKTA